VKDILVAQGFFEAITYSFESPKEMDKLLLASEDPSRRQIVISNPLGEDYSVMRTSMVPSMLRIAALNSSRSVKSASIFEIAYVYLPDEDRTKLPEEKRMLSAFTYDQEASLSKADAFYRMKGVVTELCGNLGIKSCSFEPVSDISYLHPGRTAAVFINGKASGHIGYIHPQAADNFDAPEMTVLLLLEMSAVIEAATLKRVFAPLPKFPGITRDIAVILNADIPVGSIERILKKKGG
jgi:phenylalanyl-tRNA synthetase beta chain